MKQPLAIIHLFLSRLSDDATPTQKQFGPVPAANVVEDDDDDLFDGSSSQLTPMPVMRPLLGMTPMTSEFRSLEFYDGNDASNYSPGVEVANGSHGPVAGVARDITYSTPNCPNTSVYPFHGYLYL